MENRTCYVCNGIMVYSSYFKYYYCPGCGNILYPVKTNFEIIKEMNEEEFAAFLAGVNTDDCHTCCGNWSKCIRNNPTEPICKNHYLEWLKSEAKE